jgi:hypothetical protein
VANSVLVQAADHNECHPWSFYNDIHFIIASVMNQGQVSILIDQSS